MRNRSVHFLFTVVTPVFNGEVPEQGAHNDAPKQRVVPVVATDKESKGVSKVVPLPAVSGNSTRGKYRRLFVDRSLRVAGVERKLLPKNTSYLLFAGGSTGKGAASDCPQDAYLKVYDDLPFFGLVGGSHKGVFWPGRLAVGFALPVVKETLEIFCQPGWPFAEELQMAIDVTGADLGGNRNGSLEEKGFVQRYARRDEPSLGSSTEQAELLGVLEKYKDVADALVQGDTEEIRKILGVGENGTLPTSGMGGEFVAAVDKAIGLKDAKTLNKLLDRIDEALKGEAMPFAVDGMIPPGTKLYCVVTLLPGFGANEIYEAAFDAFCELIQETALLGGAHGRGYGFVHVEARFADGKPFADHSRADEYWRWLEGRKDGIRESLKAFPDGLLASGVSRQKMRKGIASAARKLAEEDRKKRGKKAGENAPAVAVEEAQVS